MKESKSFLLLIYKYMRSAVFSAAMLYGIITHFGEQIPVIYLLVTRIGKVSYAFLQKEAILSLPYAQISAAILFLFLFVLISRVDSYWFLKMAVMLVGILFMVSSAITANDWNVLAIAAVLLYAMDTTIDIIRHKKEPVEIRGQVIVSITPFLAIAIVGSLLLPIKEKPINWRALVHGIQEMGESFFQQSTVQNS